MGHCGSFSVSPLFLTAPEELPEAGALPLRAFGLSDRGFHRTVPTTNRAKATARGRANSAPGGQFWATKGGVRPKFCPSGAEKIANRPSTP